jgi:hypothetical protein
MPKLHIGECINCEKQLFEGDRGLSYSDGPMACEDCAPTYSQAKEEWDLCAGSDPDGYARFIKGVNLHIAGGGSMGDKFIEVL